MEFVFLVIGALFGLIGGGVIVMRVNSTNAWDKRVALVVKKVESILENFATENASDGSRSLTSAIKFLAKPHEHDNPRWLEVERKVNDMFPRLAVVELKLTELAAKPTTKHVSK